MRFNSVFVLTPFCLMILAGVGLSSQQDSDPGPPKGRTPSMAQDGYSSQDRHKRTEAERDARRRQLIDEGYSVNQILSIMQTEDLLEEFKAEDVPGEAFKQGEYALVIGPSFLSDITLYTTEDAIAAASTDSGDRDRNYAVRKEMERVGQIVTAYKNTKVIVIADSKEFQVRGKRILMAKVKLLETFKEGKAGWLDTKRLKRISK